MTLNGIANSSGQAAHAQGREATSGPVAAAGLRPPNPSQEAEHFVFTSCCFCCWPFPPSVPQRTFASILAPLSLSSSLTLFPFQTTCSLNLSLSHPVTHSLHPLLQIHMGNLLTLASPDHAAGALHSFPLCLPCLLGQQALHGIPVDSIPLLNTDI